MSKEEKVIKTEKGLKNIENRCPNCGSTEIKYDTKQKKLKCFYCNTTFDEKEIIDREKDISKLTEKVIGSGARKIEKDKDSIITLKCTGCGAEVVIDTKDSSYVRCHWCHNILSINERLENGTIPDAILPFTVSQEEAYNKMVEFVKKRNFFCDKKFKKNFKKENIIGVYFPYIVVDANIEGKFKGFGEKATIPSSVAKRYEIQRYFQATIKGLTIESKEEQTKNKSFRKTNNIINSTLPFDLENIVPFESNYLIGYTSEKRDLDISNIEEKVKEEIKDIVRIRLNDTIKDYDRGVRWEDEKIKAKGSQWTTTYLPVWLYTYQAKKKHNDVTHYIAVNGRTKETSGSIPVNRLKLFAYTILLDLVLLGLCSLLLWITNDSIQKETLFLLMGLRIVICLYFYTMMFERYRNYDARHKYEKETDINLEVTKSENNFLGTFEIEYGNIDGMNNNIVKGENIKVKKDK